jgi:inner membrane protease ATP23
MWKPSFQRDYVDFTHSASLDVQVEPIRGDAGNFLSNFHHRKSIWYIKQFAFPWWRVNILLNALSAMNAPVDLISIQCPQDAQFKAGYSPTHNKVWMCANLIHNPFQYRRLLAHELLHAFDFARAKIDPTNSQHIACSEIRAYTLSGECDLWTKFFQYAADDWLGTKMFSRKQQCVKDGALRSMGGTSESKVAIDQVFDRCFRDHWPFTTEAHMDTRFRDSPMISDDRT